MRVKDKYLLNLTVTANPGDVILYNSPTASEYSFENGWDEPKEATIIEVNDFIYVTHINKHGIKCGFHKSRLIKVLKPANGQTQLFS